MVKRTSKDEKRIFQWCKQWQKTLFLNDWDIKLKWTDEDGGDDELCADTRCTTSYYEATIKFHPYFFEHSIEEQWRILVHEMIHIVLSHLQMLSAQQSNGESVSEREYKVALEQTTVRITNILMSGWPYKKDAL